MAEQFPWEDDDLPFHVAEAAKKVAQLPTFAHHLAKASVERWFAFELAAVLDDELRDEGWSCLLECGGVAGFGNIDLVIVPNEATLAGSRLRPKTDPWPTEAIAVEIKASHLGDGEAGYRAGLLADLTDKPPLAASLGRACARWVGLMITTDGLLEGSANAAKTSARAEQLRLRQLRPVSPLVVASVETIPRLTNRAWSGTVWLDAVHVFPGPAPSRENILLPAPDTADIERIFAYALEGQRDILAGDEHARSHLGIAVGVLANARLDDFKTNGRWVGTYEELRICLFFEQRRWRHFNDVPTGEEAEAIMKLFEAVRGAEPSLG